MGNEAGTGSVMVTPLTSELVVDEHEFDFGFGDDLIADVGAAADVAGAGFDADVFGFEDELVAGDDGAAELDLVEGEQERDFAGVFEFAGEEEARELGEGFDDQDAGHHGSAGVMAFKEGFVHGDVFDAQGAAVAIHFDDAVDQEHGIAVRHEAEDAADIHDRFADGQACAALRLEHLGELADHGVVEGVAALVGDELALYGAAQEIEVADEIEDFVADAFVGEAVGGADGAGGIEDEDIAGLEMGAQAAGLEHFGFGPGDEGACGCDFAGEVAVQLIGVELLFDGAGVAVVKVVEDLEFIGGGGSGDEGGAAVADFDGGR